MEADSYKTGLAPALAAYFEAEDCSGLWRHEGDPAAFKAAAQALGPRKRQAAWRQAVSLKSLPRIDALAEAGFGSGGIPGKGTPLHQACSEDWTEGVVRLLQLGFSPSHLDESGKTPCHAAAEKAGWRTIEALLAFGADFSREDRCGVGAWDRAKRSGSDETRKAIARWETAEAEEAALLEAAGQPRRPRGGPGL